MVADKDPRSALIQLYQTYLHLTLDNGSRFMNDPKKRRASGVQEFS